MTAYDSEKLGLDLYRGARLVQNLILTSKQSHLEVIAGLIGSNTHAAGVWNHGNGICSMALKGDPFGTIDGREPKMRRKIAVIPCNYAGEAIGYRFLFGDEFVMPKGMPWTINPGPAFFTRVQVGMTITSPDDV